MRSWSTLLLSFDSHNFLDSGPLRFLGKGERERKQLHDIAYVPKSFQVSEQPRDCARRQIVDLALPGIVIVNLRII